MTKGVMSGRNAMRGFTLVEVLVALVVMSILAGLSWQAVDGLVRTREAVQVQNGRLVVMGTALAQWEQDLQALLTDGPVPAIHFDGARLRLTRRAPEGVQLWCGPCDRGFGSAGRRPPHRWNRRWCKAGRACPRCKGANRATSRWPRA
jgi:prepilin-type N-terminal cleavage/methylation domain-containing protein